MRSTFALIWLCGAGCIAAQVTAVPHLVRISNTFHPANGQPAAPVEGVTLSIYRDEREGAPLWQETQNVSVDAEGRYSLLLGATLNDGLPMELFTSGEPLWLGVRFNRTGETEQPRTLLTSVPYALRALDAETLGGLPASAFLRDPSVTSSSPAAAAAATNLTPANLTPKAPKPRATSGAAGYIGVFTDPTDLGDSILYQWGGSIGLNTTTPLDHFHVVFNDGTGAVTGYAVQNLNSAGFSGMLFYDENGSLAQFQGFGNNTHEYRINNVASGGAINFLIAGTSKLYLAHSGNIGISNSTPGFALDVAGDINSSGVVRLGGSTILQAPGGPAGSNTAVGFLALGSNTTGASNIAAGFEALGSNTAGSGNVAIGPGALLDNTSGIYNTAAGYHALLASIGSGNIGIGYLAGDNVTTGSNNIEIGNAGAAGDNGTIRIGIPGTQTAFYAAGVSSDNLGADTNAIPVVIDTATGLMGVTSSSRRYKEDIQDMGTASRDLMRLRPVTFRYEKPAPDGSKPKQYGLIAEEVAEIYPDLVARSADGQIETVRYQVLDSLLLNEVQRLEKEVQELRAQLDRLAPRTP